MTFKKGTTQHVKSHTDVCIYAYEYSDKPSDVTASRQNPHDRIKIKILMTFLLIKSELLNNWTFQLICSSRKLIAWGRFRGPGQLFGTVCQLTLRLSTVNQSFVAV